MWQAGHMGKTPVPPQYHASKFNCAKCGAIAAHEWSVLLVQGDYDFNQPAYVKVFDEGPMVGLEAEQGLLWEVSLCSGCEDHSLWIGGRLVHPGQRRGGEVPEPVEGMPDDVRELYLEAAAVLPHSGRAAAALCRASLERLAKNLTSDLAPTKTLDQRLIVLSEKTTAGLAKAVQIVRHAGNTALHGARDDDKSVVIYMDGDEGDLIDMFFVTINELVDELITRPRRIQAAYLLLPESKREDIDRKIKASNGGGGTHPRRAGDVSGGA